MLRVIDQERASAQAWDLFVSGAARKNESFADYAKRIGAEARTPPPAAVSRAERERTIAIVKQRLGRFYRPPIRA